MSQTPKIVLAVLITAVVVGGGVYFWQQQKNDSLQNPQSQLQETAKQPIQNTPVAKKEPGIVTQPEIEPKLTTYSSEKYSFKYPQGYFVQEPSKTLINVLTIRKAVNQKEADEKAMTSSKNRMEIFQMKDFGDRPWGFTGEETQEDLDGYVPKDMLTVGTGDKKYNVWLYYSKNDNVTKNELMEIFQSITIK